MAYAHPALRFIEAVEALVPHPDYPVLIEPLPPEDGGSYLTTVSDLLGCMSDGETRELAARNVDDAIATWIEEARSPRPRDTRSRP